MKKLFLLAIVTLVFVGCNTNAPQQPSRICSGAIIGCVGCYDERDIRSHENLRKGVVVLTDAKDTILSFNIGADSIPAYGIYGTYTIAPVTIPYNFYYTVLDTLDQRYVKIAPIIEDAMHLPFPLRYDIDQVIITPCK